jgi:hypothetical protein
MVIFNKIVKVFDNVIMDESNKLYKVLPSFNIPPNEDSMFLTYLSYYHPYCYVADGVLFYRQRINGVIEYREEYNNLIEIEDITPYLKDII